MKRLLLTFLLLSLARLVPAAEAPLSLAVFDFQGSDPANTETGRHISALLGAELSSNANLAIVERAELDKMLGEQDLGLSGTISPETAARVGHLTGAKVLVTGRIIPSDRETLIVAKVIGTETSRVFGTTARLPAGSSLQQAAATLAKEIGDLATKNANVLVAKIETSEQRLARLKSTLKAGPLPSVSIHIPEQHFGRPAVDPAAETELTSTLQHLGFPIVDEKTGKRADYALEGEAFSERGLQRANLVSCRARLELKLRNLTTGEIVGVDREVASGVDLSEHVAAKTALENAAREITPRVLAMLSK
jgi:hypothetical protein